MQTLDQQKLITFFSLYPTFSYDKGVTLFGADEEPSGISYIVKGYVREYTISPSGIELTLHLFKPGSFFPLIWAMYSVQNAYIFETMTPVTIHRAPRDEVLEFIKKEPEILFSLCRGLLAGLDGLQSRIQYLVFGTAATRVISALLFLTKHFGEIVEKSFLLTNKFSHREIAAFAGVSRETVSRELENLRAKGIINYNARTLKIKDIVFLQKELSGSLS